MRILWILPYLPWPTTSGGKTRQYHLLRALSERGHEITLLAQSKTLLDDEARSALNPLLKELVVLPRRPLKSPKTLSAALLAPYPLLASINGFAPKLNATFERLLAEPWDIIQIEHSYTFQPYEQSLRRRGQAFLLTEHNVESALGAATYDRLPAWLRPIARFDQWRYRRWEQRVLPQAAQVIAVTGDDAAQLAHIAGRPVAVVVNGVDCARFSANQPDAKSMRLLFVGNYEYAPNIDAVHWAVEEIMPLLWLRRPQARLCICGYALPQEWSRRWTDPRLEWHGFVEDLGAMQRNSALFIAPLKHGGGSKLKVLEALAGGLPLISTAQGVSGLDLEAGHHYLGGETAATLADAAAQLLGEPFRARDIGEAGRRYVQEKHDWKNAAEQLETIYRSCREQTVSAEETARS